MTSPFRFAPSFANAALLSPTLQINERVQALWAAGQTVYHLGFGESRFPPHPKVLDALRRHAAQRSYLASQGLPALREAVAAFYTRHLNRSIKPAQVLVGPGSKALLFAAQMALEAELLLPTPSWVTYAPQARLLGRGVRQIPATASDGYALTIDTLAQTVRASTAPCKLLVLNSPNNPTGQMLAPSLLADLAVYCREQGILVLSDEIYALTAHGDTPHRSLAQYYPEATLVLGGLSKHLSLGGWRLGVAILPDHADGAQLLAAMRTVGGEIWSSPSAPVQYAAVTAYAEDAELEAYVRTCTALHALRTHHLWSWLTELGIPCAQPDGAFYLFPNFDRWRPALAARGVHTSGDLATYLLDRYRIATLPGTAFGVATDELSLRLASSYLDLETDEKADALLVAYVRGISGEQLMAEHHPHMSAAIQQIGDFIHELGASACA
jgi:aspartate aminotransferase